MRSPGTTFSIFCPIGEHPPTVRSSWIHQHNFHLKWVMLKVNFNSRGDTDKRSPSQKCGWCFGNLTCHTLIFVFSVSLKSHFGTFFFLFFQFGKKWILSPEIFPPPSDFYSARGKTVGITEMAGVNGSLLTKIAWAKSQEALSLHPKSSFPIWTVKKKVDLQENPGRVRRIKFPTNIQMISKGYGNDLSLL